MKSIEMNLPTYLLLLPFGIKLQQSYDISLKSQPTNTKRSDPKSHTETQKLSIMGVMGKSPGLLATERRGSTVNDGYEDEIREIFKTGRRRGSRNVTRGENSEDSGGILGRRFSNAKEDDNISQESEEDFAFDDLEADVDDEEEEEQEGYEVHDIEEMGEDDAEGKYDDVEGEDEEEEEWEEEDIGEDEVQEQIEGSEYLEQEPLEEGDDDEEQYSVEDTMGRDYTNEQNRISHNLSRNSEHAETLLESDGDTDEFYDAFNYQIHHSATRKLQAADVTSQSIENFSFKYPLPNKLISIKSTEARERTLPIISNDGLTVKHPGIDHRLSKNNDYSVFHSNNEVKPETGIFYYEVMIHRAATSHNFSNLANTQGNVKRQICDISFGFSTSETLGKNGWTPSNKSLGSELGSYALDGSDGTISANRSASKKFTEKVERGDIVGCGINFAKQEIFYVRNGVYLGVAFVDLKVAVVPIIGVKNGLNITVNFGTERLINDGFIFDIKGYVHNQKERVMVDILKTSYTDEFGENQQDLDIEIENTVDMKDSENNDLGKDISKLTDKIICDYFDHLGFVELGKGFREELIKELSLENEERYSFSRKTLNPAFNITTQSEQDDLDKILNIRSNIRNAIVRDNNIPLAISLIESHFPRMFSQNPRVLFKLKCQVLLIHIRNRENKESLAYGQQLQSEYFDFPDFQKSLNDIFSLLAFQNPYDSEEHSDLLNDESFQNLNDSVNESILEFLGKDCRTCLERLMIHTRELIEASQDSNKPEDDCGNTTLMVELSNFGL